MIYKRGGHYHMDVTVQGVRYREALDTTDHRKAKDKVQERIAEIKAGKGASKTGRDFARKPFGEAADIFIEERRLHVSERTHQLDKERLRALRVYFKTTPISRIRAEDIATYQRGRLNGTIRVSELASAAGVKARTINMELTVLRQMMKRAKRWAVVAEDVRMLPESGAAVARVLSPEHKALLFKVAASQDRWMVAYCAAVLAANTTCRGVELKNLRWADVDLFARTITIRRSKTESGLRTIPLTNDALTALTRLRARSEKAGAVEPEHFVFPTCESNAIDPTKPQKSWRTAWRALVAKAGTLAAARAKDEATGGRGEEAAAKALAAFTGLRFHDLRHQAITELAEAGASDATLMSLAGHMTRRMMEHYSHVRMQRKREALAVLDMGLMQSDESDAGEIPALPM